MLSSGRSLPWRVENPPRPSGLFAEETTLMIRLSVFAAMAITFVVLTAPVQSEESMRLARIESLLKENAERLERNADLLKANTAHLNGNSARLDKNTALIEAHTELLEQYRTLMQQSCVNK